MMKEELSMETEMWMLIFEDQLQKLFILSIRFPARLSTEYKK